ncbi:MAG: lipocalin-like domain-containing protein [Gammaproteobacteria bacterium]|nr:lipocalin-like domain-containing protein [Gammaproteobacteria bacterium]MDH4253498.1 lipocalin-like domain-containing protein [Gammaproteobacteria bacterium]MDH5309731.1 lipocalin-like domain-containing protein [Gammaproteobacteria bacterium]
MPRTMLPLLLSLLAFHAAAAAELEGAFERVSLTNQQSGESSEAANRRGLLLLAHGHYSMMTVNPDRRTLAAGQKLEDLPTDEQLAFLREWLDINAHSGRYEADGTTLTWYRDLSEDPKEVGTVSRLAYELRDDLLVIRFTLPNGDVYDWVWRRL